MTKPAGFEFNIYESQVFHRILNDYCEQFFKICFEQKPVRVIKYTGPLFTDFNHSSWMKDVMDYIQVLIHEDTEETFSPMDPFQVNKVELLFKTRYKGEDFFSCVRTLCLERAQDGQFSMIVSSP